MKVLDPGHIYLLNVLDEDEHPSIPDFCYDRLQFVKRQGPKYPGNKGHYPGTTCQEVLRACVDRLQYVNNQIPDEHNSYAIEDLKWAIWELECRAAERHGRDKPSLEDAVHGLTCPKCNHVGCKGECH